MPYPHLDADMLRAMARWPNVPSVFGWLALDRGGRWLLRGVPIKHARILQAVNANYSRDDRGRWFFQNGPQRVFVALPGAPWVVHRISEDAMAWRTQTGLPITRVTRTWIDEDTALYWETEHGLALVSDRDLGSAFELIHDTQERPADFDRFNHWLDEGVVVEAEESEVFRYRWLDGSVPIGRSTRAYLAAHYGFENEPRDPGPS
ncbi:DUF2946 family protein [Sulfidibacter corallicola]|uniref:DUF2946 family protein n=1 Tax=Sulfidibacter corallicola TaxID=2818388 RepID=A0A8A4TJ88_SULCO|nr:DUF2946 family protein [Sulfidibacter corallicola]QTD49986.1 DUF2946 family protein [Sulfidibacter corallicola]